MKDMRNLTIQYPDGRYHSVNATRFFGILIDGKEQYILEYDDLTENARNCFTVLNREGNTFVKKPLGSQSAYALLAARIRFMPKRPYNLNLLPGKIGLCREALNELNSATPRVQQASAGSPPPPPFAPPVRNNNNQKQPPAQAKPRLSIIVYEDIGPNHAPFPFYIKQSAAKSLGWGNSLDGYYHLTPAELDELRRNFEIKYERINLSPKKKIVVYKDVSDFRDVFPYYLDADTARSVGYSNIQAGYYHLTQKQLDELKNKFDIEYRERILSLGVKTKQVIDVYKDVSSGHDPFPYYLDPYGNRPLTPGQLEELKRKFEVRIREIYLNKRSVFSNNNSVVKGPVMIYIDIASNHDEFPYYLDSLTAVALGFVESSDSYYHLTSEQLDKVKSMCEIRYMNVLLGFGPKENFPTNRPKPVTPIPPKKGGNTNPPKQEIKLSEEEVKTLEDLFDRMMDFEDYYQFFGIEHLRGASAAEVVNSPRIVNLSVLFKKGAACGNEIAINLEEFLEGFKKSLKEKTKNI